MAAYPGVTMSKAGTSVPLTVNLMSGYHSYFGPSPAWALGLICTLSSGATLTYAVQVTGDPAPTSSGNWNDHDTLTAKTASANGNVAFPITGIRLNITSYTSGSVNLAVVQWP